MTILQLFSSLIGLSLLIVLYITVYIHKITLWALWLFYLDCEFKISEADLWQLYLASYPGSWWVGRKRVWYILFVHAHNYLLLNTCSSNSGRGTCNIHSHWGCRRLDNKKGSALKSVSGHKLYLNNSIQWRLRNEGIMYTSLSDYTGMIEVGCDQRLKIEKETIQLILSSVL